MSDDAQAKLFTRFYRDRVLAHKILFAHRHPQALTAAHEQFIGDWHGLSPQVLDLAFRGFAKSTLAEEGILLLAAFRQFRNCLIVGSNKDRAVERLQAVRYEIKTNDKLAQVFGDLLGPMDAEDKIILSNDVMIQAIGRGQALRGVKYLDQRPDFVFVDDLETKGDVKTPEAREETRRWFFTELLPACDEPRARKIRVCATPLDADALPMNLARDATWLVRVYPIIYRDEAGAFQPLWPERFPMEEIEKIRSSFTTQGLLREFDMEYMCEASSPADKPFRADMFKTQVMVRNWQAAFCMFDPARTAKRGSSATTGFACWSWIGNRLIVWDGWCKYLMPDEIINEVFNADDEHHPTIIGVEEDGLNEFLMQPIRHEQTRRGVVLPVKPMKAPKGKMDFIRALQPFFITGEIVFAKELPDFKQQFLAFPTGLIDGPNALAYALKMRPGAPFYDGFSMKHVMEDMSPSRSATPWLCMNATRGIVTAVLVQLVQGGMRIFADWVREGDAIDVLRDIMQEANLEAGRQVKLVAAPKHWDTYHNVGLVQAARHVPVEIRRGADCAVGRAELRRLLDRDNRGQAALLVDDRARWTLNGFAGGYSRTLNKQGVLTDESEDNYYRVLMEGLECFASLLKAGDPDGGDDDRVYGYTENGAKYLTARR